MNKKIMLIGILVALISATTYFYTKGIKQSTNPPLDSLDSRIRTQSLASPDPDDLTSTAINNSDTALAKIEKNSPHKTNTFSVEWDVKSHKANVVLSASKDVAMSDLLTWLDSIGATNYPTGSLNIISN